MTRRYSPDQELRMLSLYQPWASLILYGTKGNETRSWHTSYRGWVAIHAGKQRLDGVGVHILLKARKLCPEVPERWFYDGKGFRQDGYPTGAIVALAWLEECQSMTQWSVVVSLLKLILIWRVKCSKAEEASLALLPHWWLVWGFVVSLTSCAVEIGSQSQLEQTVGDWKMGRFAWKLSDIQPLSQPMEAVGGWGLRWVKDETVKAAIAASLVARS